MTIEVPQRLLDPGVRWIEPSTGRPTKEFYLYMKSLDEVVRELISVSNTHQTTLDDHETRITALEP